MTFDVLFDDHHNGNYDNDYGVVDDDDAAAATAIATDAYEGKTNACVCMWTSLNVFVRVWVHERIAVCIMSASEKNRAASVLPNDAMAIYRRNIWKQKQQQSNCSQLKICVASNKRRMSFKVK